MALASAGVDMAKADFAASVVQEGERYLRERLPNSLAGFQGLCAWLEAHKLGQVHVCLEATGNYGLGLATYLYEQGHKVSVINPSLARAYARSELRRNKTDRLDSDLLARYCRDKQPALWAPLPKEIAELQALERRLEALEQMRAQEANRLGSGLRSKQVRESVEATLAFLSSEIDKLKAALEQQLASQEQLRRQSELLTSIPGIGTLTAARILAECPDAKSFTSVRKFVAYSGLTPSNRISGSSVRGRASCSKLGSARLRKALYMPALVARRFNPLVRAFCERLEARGKPKMAVIGAAMAKLLRLAYGVLKSGKPFDANHLPAPG